MKDLTKTAVYAGSFDPITFGHLWVINESSLLFNKLIIAIGKNAQKNCSFDLNTRIYLLEKATCNYKNVEIKILGSEFLINYALSMNIKYIIRGIRNSNDYEYEKMMRYINSDICDKIQTIFFMPPREYAEVSSNLIKSLVGTNGWEKIVSRYVSSDVVQKLKEKFC